MLKIILANLVILVLAFGYWFLVDYLYARSYELYHPYEWLMELSFVVFALISFDCTSKILAKKKKLLRLSLSLAIPAVLSFFFLLVLNYFGLDFHIWVGELLFP